MPSILEWGEPEEWEPWDHQQPKQRVRGEGTPRTSKTSSNPIIRTQEREDLKDPKMERPEVGILEDSCAES